MGNLQAPELFGVRPDVSERIHELTIGERGLQLTFIRLVGDICLHSGILVSKRALPLAIRLYNKYLDLDYNNPDVFFRLGYLQVMAASREKETTKREYLIASSVQAFEFYLDLKAKEPYGLNALSALYIYEHLPILFEGALNHLMQAIKSEESIDRGPVDVHNASSFLLPILYYNLAVLRRRVIEKGIQLDDRDGIDYGRTLVAAWNLLGNDPPPIMLAGVIAYAVTKITTEHYGYKFPDDIARAMSEASSFLGGISSLGLKAIQRTRNICPIIIPPGTLEPIHMVFLDLE
jgi:hypothetical protein